MSKVVFHSLIQKVTGDRSIVINEATTVGEVIEILANRYGQRFRDKIISSEGDLSPYVSIFLNNRDVRTLNGLPTPVHENDEISFLPTVTGG